MCPLTNPCTYPAMQCCLLAEIQHQLGFSCGCGSWGFCEERVARDYEPTLLSQDAGQLREKHLRLQTPSYPVVTFFSPVRRHCDQSAFSSFSNGIGWISCINSQLACVELSQAASLIVPPCGTISAAFGELVVCWTPA